MTLRQRLAVATVAVTIPIALLLLWYDSARQHAVAEQLLAGMVTSRMVSERDRCETAPESFGGEVPHMPPGRPGPRPGLPPPPPDAPRPGGPPPPEKPHARTPVVFAYDDQFQSRNPRAPALSPSLKEAIRTADLAAAPFGFRSHEVQVLVATGRSGPCAYALALGTTDPEWGVLPASHLWTLPTIAVFAAMLLALGPVVRRIQRLTKEVQRSAKSDYAHEIPEEGRDEIAALARAFNQAGREIRAQLAEKDRRERALRDFLANTTHDVMIPLTVLQGHLASLREAGPDPRTVVSAMREAHYMASLVHNLGAVARLEAAEASPARDPVDLGALVRRVLARHRPIARELEVAIEAAVPEEAIQVLGDVTLLEQAASNVAYNAVRHNRPGGHVAIILDRSGERFSLRVIDDGPGIPESARARLTQRGERGNEARTRAPGGQGLGLHIAFRAADAHGFDLSLGASEYGGLEVKLEGPVFAGFANGDRAL